MIFLLAPQFAEAKFEVIPKKISACAAFLIASKTDRAASGVANFQEGVNLARAFRLNVLDVPVVEDIAHPSLTIRAGQTKKYSRAAERLRSIEVSIPKERSYFTISGRKNIESFITQSREAAFQLTANSPTGFDIVLYTIKAIVFTIILQDPVIALLFMNPDGVLGRYINHDTSPLLFDQSLLESNWFVYSQDIEMLQHESVKFQRVINGAQWDNLVELENPGFPANYLRRLLKKSIWISFDFIFTAGVSPEEDTLHFYYRLDNKKPKRKKEKKKTGHLVNKLVPAESSSRAK